LVINSMDIGLIIVLIFINGFFAMSELSIVSSRKSRLQKLASEQRPGAKAAISLHNEPSRFLSTIQIGITSIGILSGAIGEYALASPINDWLMQIPYLAPYAKGIALASTVILITYLSVVIGELVPKRLALQSPEVIALKIARPMIWLAKLVSPMVWLLSSSSNVLLRLFGMHRKKDTSVTNEEINLLMQLGAEAGVFHESEGQIVSNVLKLDEQRVGIIMTPRNEVFALDLDDSEAELLNKVIQCPYSKAVICRNGLENVLGILHRSDLLKPALEGAKPDIEKALRPPLYIPDSMTVTHLLENFRKARTEFALIVDEYGDMQGIVTLNDVLSVIVGEFPSEASELDPEIVQRSDGSWLVDGGITMARLKTMLNINSNFPGEEANVYNTLGGFVVFHLERIPSVAEHFEYAGWRFEVVDMDKARVDKILMARQKNISDS
jgi:putative hemolysin